MPRPTLPQLTPEQITRAGVLRAHSGDGKRSVRSWRGVGHLMGLSETALLRHFAPDRYQRMLARDRKKHAPDLRRAIHFREISDREGGHFKVPPDVLADRDRRMQIAMQQDPIAALLGEPPPERSALDRKLARSS